MARQDLLGLLTGVQSTQQPISATNPQDWRMQFGQRQSEKMNQRLRGLTGRMSTQEALGAGLGKLDPTKPEHLKIIANLQRSAGDLAGAAQTIARIQAMATAKAQEDRAERGLKVTEERLAMQKAATDRQLDIEETQLLQQGVSRKLLAKQAREDGNEKLAGAIEGNLITLEKASSLIFGTSNAVIKAPTADEEKAFDRILDSNSFKDKIESLKEGGWFGYFESLTEETRQAIYFKAKEIMTRQKQSPEKALEQAITSVKLLDQIPEGSDTKDKVKRVKRDRRGRPIQPVKEQVESQDDDAYLNLDPNKQ